MIWITLIRITIGLTFLLLIIEGIGAVILARYFFTFYMRKHRILEVRIEAIERIVDIVKEPPK